MSYPRNLLTKKLVSMSLDQKDAGLAVLEELGITRMDWAAMKNFDLRTMVNFVQMCLYTCYDAEMVGRLLDLPTIPYRAPITSGLVVYYGGWTPQTLRTSALGRKFMKQARDDSAYEQFDWYDEHNLSAKPGYYRVVLRVPGTNNSQRSNFKEWLKNLEDIDSSWEPAPMAVILQTLLIRQELTGEPVLRNREDIYCRESFDHRTLGNGEQTCIHMAIRERSGLIVPVKPYGWVGQECHDVLTWLAAAEYLPLNT